MSKADNTARSSTKEKVHERNWHRRTKKPRDIQIKLEEVREQKQAEQQRQLEERKEELQQIKDQNLQTPSTQFQGDPTAKEEVREKKRNGTGTEMGTEIKMDSLTLECVQEFLVLKNE